MSLTELRDAAENLKSAIDRFVALAEISLRAESSIQEKPQPVAETLQKRLSRKERQFQKEVHAMVILTRMGGNPDIHLIADEVRQQFGSCNYGSLYRYPRFMRLYKLAKAQAAEAAKASLPKGYRLSSGDDGLEAVDCGSEA